MAKFIHTSDWHLGMPAYFLPEQQRVRFAQDRFDAVRTIARLATEEGCGFVVVAGDVFDSNDVDQAVISKAVDAMGEFTVPVFILPGNHDCLNASSVYRSRAWTDRKPTRVHVIEEAVPLLVPGTTGVEVLGAPVTTKHPLGDPLADTYAAPPSVPGVLRVLVGHGQVDALDPSREEIGVISSSRLRETVEREIAQYVALGDRHSVTEVASAAYYSGTPVAAPVSGDWSEQRPNQVLLVALDQDGLAVDTRQVGSWSFVDVAADLNSEGDVAALEASLDALPDKPRTVARLKLTGTLTLPAEAALSTALARFEDLFASIYLWGRHTNLVTVPGDGDLDSLNVTGYEREAVDELRGLAPTDETARDALKLLFRLAQ